MRGYLLDTNLISELFKKKPSSSVIDRVTSVEADRVFTSAICAMELRYGTQRHPNGRKLWRQISDSVFPRIRVLPLRFNEAKQAADILAELASQGEPIGLEDVLIGATAMTNGLTVATRNLRHFNRIRGLQAESWWDD